MFTLTRIDAFSLRCPIETPVETSFGIMRDRPAVLVRIEDSEGGFGWGEVFANWPAAGAEHRVHLLERDISPLVLGQSFATADALFGRLRDQTRIRAVQCGEEGPFAQVIAGLDIAMWDLAARRAGVALRHLIRADAPQQVPAYASGIHVAAADQIVPRMRALGHQTFKLKVGFDRDRDLAALRAMVATLRSCEALATDANQAWDLALAQAFCQATEDLDLLWLEEPMPVFAPPEDWHMLARATGTPLAGGENLRGSDAFGDAIARADLQVLQPDVAKWGGITGCLAVAREARAQGLRYCPHFLGAGIGLAASAELLAGVGGDGLLEVDVNPNPLRSAFFDDCEPIEGGMWHCSEGPGLGIEALPQTLEGHVTARTSLTL